MSKKQSLYNKYRPSTFSDVIGQKVAKDILVNSIEKEKINHAYLLHGIRGTGKTTLARIFAKSINCSNFSNGDPCGKCESCESIGNGSSFDVIEIDAASNNGVDEIRKIKENTNYLTTSINYKVYIIDEVHMLTKSAFNALLKTLEEPPMNTIFLLATTELQKIPQTVLSRVIVINLEVMSDEDITKGLEVILKGEGVEYDELAVSHLVLVSGGSLRDAISNLETSLLYNNKLTVENVVDSLGIINKENLKDMLLNDMNKLFDETNSVKKDPKKILLIILEVLLELIEEGRDEFVGLLNNLITFVCDIKDPYLLRVAIRTSLFNVSRETFNNNKEDKSTSNIKTNINSSNIKNDEESNKDVPRETSKPTNNPTEIKDTNNNTPLINKTNVGEDKDVPRETLKESNTTPSDINTPLNNLETNLNSQNNIEEDKGVSHETPKPTNNPSEIKDVNNNTPLINKTNVGEDKDVSRGTSNGEQNTSYNEETITPNKKNLCVTDFATANNYMYIMIKSDDLTLETVKGKWRYIDNYITSLTYKEIVSSLIGTTPLAACDKTIIVSFETEQQINEFKRISLTPKFFKFINDVLGEYKFVLPINKEKWSKLEIARNQGYELTSVNKDIDLMFEDYIGINNKEKKDAINNFFGKGNVSYE